MWPSAPLWPMIYYGDHFHDFVVSWMDLPTAKEAFVPGRYLRMFGVKDLSFRMLALRISFDC